MAIYIKITRLEHVSELPENAFYEVNESGVCRTAKSCPQELHKNFRPGVVVCFCSQAEYDSIVNKDSETIYLVGRYTTGIEPPPPDGDGEPLPKVFRKAA